MNDPTKINQTSRLTNKCANKLTELFMVASTNRMLVCGLLDRCHAHALAFHPCFFESIVAFSLIKEASWEKFMFFGRFYFPILENKFTWISNFYILSNIKYFFYNISAPHPLSKVSVYCRSGDCSNGIAKALS